jgi:hypothetical protein
MPPWYQLVATSALLEKILPTQVEHHGDVEERSQHGRQVSGPVGRNQPRQQALAGDQGSVATGLEAAEEPVVPGGPLLQEADQEVVVAQLRVCRLRQTHGRRREHVAVEQELFLQGAGAGFVAADVEDQLAFAHKSLLLPSIKDTPVNGTSEVGVVILRR